MTTPRTAWSDEEIISRVASDIEDGWAINLGVGMPTLMATNLSERNVMLHSENGILGMGRPALPEEQDPDLVNAGKGMTTFVPGAATMDSVTSFTLIRGGRLDLSIMGAYQVSHIGDLANWRLPGHKVAGVGGAADLAVGAKRVWVMMKYFAKDGTSRIVPQCTFPLTASRVVSRVYTDHGTFVRRDQGEPLVLTQWPQGADPDEISRSSGCAIETGNVPSGGA